MNEVLKPHPKLREFFEAIDEINPEALKALGLEAAILGYIERIGSNPLIVYDREICIQIFMREGMTHEEAEEHFSYNVIGAYQGEGTPVFMTKLEDIVF